MSGALKFEKDVTVNDDEGKPKSCRVAIAFNLEAHQEQEIRTTDKQEIKTPKKKKASIPWRIIPLSPGKVSIFFPADKETSNLKFHLHAPFASTVSRDSVRECLANNELRDQIAELVSDSMSIIRDLKLLNVGFLRTLPNDKDELSEFYLPIQAALVKAFQNNELVPMKNGGYAASSGIYRGSANLSNLIDDDDLAMILGEDYFPPMWISNPPQRNQREDNFLSMLDIREWDIDDLVEALDDSEVAEKLLSEKSDHSHQQLYAMLNEYYSKLNFYQKDKKEQIRNLCIVRLSGGSYSVGSECFFPSDGVEQDETLPRVAEGIFSSGKNKNQQEKALRYLENIGVRKVGESDQVKAILKQRYTNDAKASDEKTYRKDLDRFITLVKTDPANAKCFADYYVFESIDGKRKKPSQVYLDLPFEDTGLRDLFKCSEIPIVKKMYPISKKYEKVKGLKNFAKTVGVMYALEIRVHEATEMQKSVFPVEGNRTASTVDEDYYINGLKGKGTYWHCKGSDNYLGDLDLKMHRFELSLAVWKTLCRIEGKKLSAFYRPNDANRNKEKKAPAFLINQLKNCAWIPDKNRRFQLPQDVTRESLHSNFLFDNQNGWLDAIGFGENAKKATDEYATQNIYARKIGFESTDEAAKALEIIMLCRQSDKSPDELIEQMKSVQIDAQPTFPERTSFNPDRRRERVAEQLTNARGKEYERRNRSVRTTRESIDPTLWLRNQYKNEDGQMICQVCKKKMPFRKRDGEHYFETVEALTKEYFVKEHESQYLALCPLCAAMYKEFIKRDEKAMMKLKDELMNSEGFEVPLRLGELDTSIRFVETHFHDIKTIIETSIQDDS